MKNSKFATLVTPYAGRMDFDSPWNIYPRPQMVRDSFFSLNGRWDFELTDSLVPPSEYSKKILVPFPPESLLSGIDTIIPKGAYLAYRRKFTLPHGFVRDRVILHFGAVDTECCVFINGSPAGGHSGGYIPFSLDITDMLRAGENEIAVTIEDNLSRKFPYGKQRRKRGGMWYTPVSGIWQTVWIESLPKNPILSLKIEQSDKNAKISINSKAESAKLILLDTNESYDITGGSVTVEPREPKLWTPETPHLYRFAIETQTDRVESYFALRSLSVKTVRGKERMCLNGKPYFFSALLDQGYYPDGIFLPASEDAYRDDILLAKRLGFNTLRKHIKIEPMVFYYLCDKLGMIVFQDMVNNSSYSFILDTALPTIGFKRYFPSLRHRCCEAREIFLSHMAETAELLYNTPSVCLYTIFNEGWGEFSPDECYDRLKALDPTRFIDATSGWFYAKRSDLDSRHIYFKNPTVKNPNGRPYFLSEFGGFSLRVPRHVYGKRNYGYSSYPDAESFTDAVFKLYTEGTLPLIREGLSAAVYTQLSDVEDETNGLITYDRRVVKIDEKKMSEANMRLYTEFEKATT